MAQLTERQAEILSRLDAGMMAPAIAHDLGITRNAVYQQIQRMRRDGALPHDFTPTGQPPRDRPGEDVITRLLAHNGTDPQEAAAAGAVALLQELRRTRDEIDAISRRLSQFVPR